MVGVLVTVLLAGLSFSAEIRVWTDAEGILFEGTYYKELLGGILVKDTRGKNRRIFLDQLSIADRNYTERCIPPEVEVTVDYKTRELARMEWSKDDDYTTFYTFDVNVEKTSKLPHKGQLSAELFVIGSERSVESRNRAVLMHYFKTRFVFPDQENAACEFTVPDVKFNKYRAGWVELSKGENRGKTYLGYIIAVYDFSGSLIFTDTDIPGCRWLTDDIPLSVEKLRDLAENNKGSIESRHFNDSLRRIDPPRIPWFKRTKNY